MDIFKILSFTITSLVLVVFLSETRKDIALLISIFAGVIILIFVIGAMDNIIQLLQNLANKSGVNSKYMEVIIKVTAIAYLIEFGKNICIDSGQTSLATKLELAGKIAIVSLTIPVITSVIEVITKLM